MTTMLESIPDPYRLWVWLALTLLGAVAGACVLHALLYWVADRLTSKTTHVADTSVVTHTRGPARVVLIFVAIRCVIPAWPISAAAVAYNQHLATIGFIASLTWLIIRAMSVIDDVILSRHRVDVSDNLQARRIHTQTRVLSRTAMVIVGLVGVSAVLMTFPNIRQLGASLLASAGLAGLAIGMAARPTLANLIAGIQLALTQPIRLDDVVIVENEWGWIEEITATYVVVRIWDQRRLIVPLQYFIEHPFQNWTRSSADILGTVCLYADYTAPVGAIRDELQRIAQASEQWDKRVCVLQVTNATDRTVELRALVSAADSGAAWDLRCIVREKLIAFLQREHPGCLPRVRAELIDTPPDAGAVVAAATG